MEVDSCCGGGAPRGVAAGPAAIGPEDTIREILRTRPGLRPVLDRHGLLACGGPEGPPETLRFFASVHGADLEALVSELNAGAGASGAPRPAPVPAGPLEASRIWAPFVGASLLFLLSGAAFGALNLLARTLPGSRFVPGPDHHEAHAHAMVFGWLLLFVAGIALHVLPRISRTPPASPLRASWILALLGLGAAMRSIFQPFGARPGVAALVPLSAFLEAAGIALFVTDAFGRTRGLGAPGAFLRLGLLSLGAAAAGNLALAAGIAVALSPAAWPPGREALSDLVLLGFAAPFVFGIALHTMPRFLGIRRRGDGAALAALILWAAGLVLAAAAPFRSGAPALPASLFLLAGGALYVRTLGILGRREHPGPSAPAPYEPLLAAAFAWLLASLLLRAAGRGLLAAGAFAPGGALETAALHALAIGFLAQVVFGMGLRMIPHFEGRPLDRPDLVPALFLLVNAAGLLRVLGRALVPAAGRIGAAGEALSALPAVAAFAIFSSLVVRTIRPRAPVPSLPPGPSAVSGGPSGSGPPAALRAAPIGPESTVGEIVERHPQTLPVFLERGFTHLKNPLFRATIAKTVPLAHACRMHGVPLPDMLAVLNQTLEPSSLKAADQESASLRLLPPS